MADVTGRTRCSSSILGAPLSKCSSVGRTLAAILIAERSRWFESIHSDGAELI